MTEDVAEVVVDSRRFPPVIVINDLVRLGAKRGLCNSSFVAEENRNF